MCDSPETGRVMSVELWWQKFNDDTIHPYLRAWFGWKLLQNSDKLYQLTHKNNEKITREALRKIYETQRSVYQQTLSPYVSKCLDLDIIKRSIDLSNTTLDNNPLLDKNTKLLSMEAFSIQQLLREPCPVKSNGNADKIDEMVLSMGLSDEEVKYLAASMAVKKAAITIHHCLQSAERDYLRQLYSKYLEEYSCYGEDILSIYFEYLDERYDARTIFAVCCSYFERKLGDVFTGLVGGDPSKCPRILRDLLDTQELQQAIGPDMLFLLNILIGPPIGLNLRNVIWHGFLSADDFDPCYLSFFVVLMATFADIFSRCSAKPVKRNLFILNSISVERYDFGLGSGVFLDAPLTEAELASIEEIVKDSLFVLTGRNSTVVTAFRRFAATPIDLEHGCIYQRILTNLLPEVEQSLRRLFVACNDLPNPLLLAESRRYFTTMDMFMTCKIEVDLPEFDGRPNLLLDELGPTFVNALLDFFIHPFGLRPRDRISHGEADPTLVPRIIVDRLFSLYLALCIHYNSNFLDNPEGFLDSLPQRISQCYRYYQHYKSCFHPSSVLQRQLLSSFRKLRDFDNEIIAKYPLRDSITLEENASADDEMFWYSHRRNDAASLESDLRDVCTQLIVAWKGDDIHSTLDPNSVSAALQLCILFDVTIDGDEFYDTDRHPLLKGHLLGFCTIGRPSSEISDMEAARELTKRAGLIFQTIRLKVLEQHEAVTTGRASKRAQSSFYRLLGTLDAFRAIGVLLCLLAELFLWRFPPVVRRVPGKHLIRWCGVVDRMKNMWNDNQWDRALECINDVWIDLKKKLQPVLESQALVAAE